MSDYKVEVKEPTAENRAARKAPEVTVTVPVQAIDPEALLAQAQYLEIAKEINNTFPPDAAKQVAAIALRIELLVLENFPSGHVALALVGAKAAAGLLVPR